MLKLVKRTSKKTGLPPGTLVHVGERKTETPRITVLDYDEAQVWEKEIESIEECFPLKDTTTVTWINIDGIHQPDIIETIGRHFDLHHLLQEDILNTSQRPKLEDFEAHVFIIVKMLQYDGDNEGIHAEQVSLVLGPHFVISFQESQGDVFDAVRTRIRQAKGRIRKMGADYLAYALLDAIVDGYFEILERVAEDMETMEEQLLAHPDPESLTEIHKAKTTMALLRKFIWPLREVVGAMARGDCPLIREATTLYFRDVHDHTIRIVETIETFREMVFGMQDLYLSSISNRMNEVMKILTIIATIFIPLTFIAGIYGMNFEYMPELKWHWGYFGVWGIMVAILVAMVVYFRRKRWL